jgi:Fe-S cluster biogenesis protein NfuA
VQHILLSTVNPQVAAHRGVLERVADGNVDVRLEGGCQGCAQARVTLRNGVERVLKETPPEIRSVIDVTDHAAGTDPYLTDDCPA